MQISFKPSVSHSARRPLSPPQAPHLTEAKRRGAVMTRAEQQASPGRALANAAAVGLPVASALAAGYAVGKTGAPATELMSEVLSSPASQVTGALMGGMVGTVANHPIRGFTDGMLLTPLVVDGLGAQSAALALAVGPMALVGLWCTRAGADALAKGILGAPRSGDENGKMLSTRELASAASAIAYAVGVILGAKT